MLRIDLHLHSVYSDGVLSPLELALKLDAGKVSVAALTDHDSTEGVRAFMDACRRRSIRAVSGVELSSAYDGVLHILGYRFDVADGGMRALLEQNRRDRHKRNLAICRKLQDLGLNVSFEEAGELAGSDVVGRPHIARVMCRKGYVPNQKAAFDRYLGRGGKAYVSRPLPEAEECIRAIREAGGLPVLAHPLQTTPDLDDLPPLTARLKAAGLWGLECWSPCNGVREIYRCLEIAENFQLYPTAGSDFHGKGHSVASVGVSVREDLLPWARFCGGL